VIRRSTREVLAQGCEAPCLNLLKECFVVHDVRNFVHFAFLSSDQASSYYFLTLIVFFLGGGLVPTFTPGGL
jgi:hypothetical protein